MIRRSLVPAVLLLLLAAGCAEPDPPPPPQQQPQHQRPQGSCPQPADPARPRGLVLLEQHPGDPGPFEIRFVDPDSGRVTGEVRWQAGRTYPSMIFDSTYTRNARSRSQTVGFTCPDASYHSVGSVADTWPTPEYGLVGDRLVTVRKSGQLVYADSGAAVPGYPRLVFGSTSHRSTREHPQGIPHVAPDRLAQSRHGAVAVPHGDDGACQVDPVRPGGLICLLAGRILLRDPDHRPVRRLAPNVEHPTLADVTADGRAVVLTSEGSAGALYLAPRSGADAVPVEPSTPLPQYGDVYLASPDGTAIAVAARAPATPTTTRLFIVPVQGGPVRLVGTFESDGIRLLDWQ